MCSEEIGGYLGLDRQYGSLLHEGAIALNSGRNCLAYLIRSRGIRKLALPRFLCSSVADVCRREKVSIRYYSVGTDLRPEEILLDEDEWLYIVNYYGQLEREALGGYAGRYGRVIVDNAQAYFQPPVRGIDTLYSCRKYFGVPDGAFLYTDAISARPLTIDVSWTRMRHILGRFEEAGNAFFSDYQENEKSVGRLELQRMSKLTENLLRAIDYARVRERRDENFAYLEQVFSAVNRLRLIRPEGAFMYPLLVDNGGKIRKKLWEKKIYVPVLWPDVFDLCEQGDVEYAMADDILPLPIDQRYGQREMQKIVEAIEEAMAHV